MTVSRRTLLGLAAAGAASVVAGCSRAARSAADRSTTAPPSRPVPATSASSAPAAADGATTSSGATSSSGSTPAAAPRGPAIQVAHGPRTHHEVALTFHGAGDPGLARELLDVVEAHSAHITVMAVGSWLAEYPAMAHRIVSGGHELGNHTYHHLDIDALPRHHAREEIVRCRDLLQSLVGSGGAHFRQSQSPTASRLVRELAGAAGYPVCLSYDIDSLDWTDPGPAAIRRNVARARPGSIVSMHLGHAGTVEALPHVLGDLSQRGLTPVTATSLLRA